MKVTFEFRIFDENISRQRFSQYLFRSQQQKQKQTHSLELGDKTLIFDNCTESCDFFHCDFITCVEVTGTQNLKMFTLWPFQSESIPWSHQVFHACLTSKTVLKHQISIFCPAHLLRCSDSSKHQWDIHTNRVQLSCFNPSECNKLTHETGKWPISLFQTFYKRILCDFKQWK